MEETFSKSGESIYFFRGNLLHAFRCGLISKLLQKEEYNFFQANKKEDLHTLDVYFFIVFLQILLHI